MSQFRLHRPSHLLRAVTGVACCFVSLPLVAQPAAGAASAEAAAGDDAARTASGTESGARFEPFLPVRPLEQGFQLGLASGVSWPVGNADGGVEVGDIAFRSGELSGVVQHRVPIAIEAGYRLDPHWWVGAIPEIGFGGYGDECVGPQGACDFTDFRLTAGATWYPLGNPRFSPWLRLTAGYEWLKATLELEDGFSGSETLSGPLAQLQLGVDWLVGETFAFGPYLAAAAGSYLSSSFTCQPATCPSDSSVEDKDLHGWVSIGLRATHGP